MLCQNFLQPISEFVKSMIKSMITAKSKTLIKYIEVISYPIDDRPARED